MLSKLVPNSKNIVRQLITRSFIKIKPEEKKQAFGKEEILLEEEKFKDVLKTFGNRLNTKDSRMQKLDKYKPIITQPQYHISLENNFLYGFEKEDFEGFNPILQKSFSLQNATEGQIIKYKKAMAMRKFQKDEHDTGSPGVRISMITEKMLHMIKHIKYNKTDFKCFRYFIFIFLYYFIY